MLEQLEFAANESGDNSEVLQEMEAEWDAVVKSSPAMARLPRMVAEYYVKEVYQGPDTFEQFQQNVAESVRLGTILLFRLLGGSFLDRMFESFSRRFGQAIEMLMDDVEFTYQNDKDVVENYTPEQLCGRLFALLAMIIDSQHLDENDALLDQVLFDDNTGFNKDLNTTSVLLILAYVVNCAGLGDDGALKCFTEGRGVVLGFAFHLKEKTASTRCH